MIIIQFGLVCFTCFGICCLNCSSIVENAGTQLDPGYGRYSHERTLERRLEDERKQQEIQNQLNAEKQSRDAIEKFNSNIETKNSKPQPSESEHVDSEQ